MSEEIDVRELELPRYVEKSPTKLSLRIREFPGTAPVTIQVDPEWTVEHAERKFARAKEKNPQSVRFTINGQPLPKTTKISNLSPPILSGEQVIDAAPEHGLGSRLAAGLPNFDRIRNELMDLPCKRGYGSLFRVTLRSLAETNQLRPILHIMFQAQWYTYQLDLANYPECISGRFIGALPPCPQHGGKHPHVYRDGTFCWEIQRNWRPSMTLAEDYIAFMLKALNYPKEHSGCGSR
jgi:hypothetical protein